MNNKINMRPVPGKPVKGPFDGAFMRHIAFHHQIRADGLCQRPQPLAEPLHLIGEGKLGTLLRRRSGNAPGAGTFIRDPHDETTLSC